MTVILPDTSAPCASAYQYNSSESEAILRIARETGGDLFFSMSTYFRTFLPNYLSTLYRTTQIGDVLVRNCSDFVGYFPIDSGVKSFAVSYTGAGADSISLTITDSTNKVVPLPDNATLFAYSYFVYLDVKIRFEKIIFFSLIKSTTPLSARGNSKSNPRPNGASSPFVSDLQSRRSLALRTSTTTRTTVLSMTLRTHFSRPTNPTVLFSMQII